MVLLCCLATAQRKVEFLHPRFARLVRLAGHIFAWKPLLCLFALVRRRRRLDVLLQLAQMTLHAGNLAVILRDAS